MDGITPICPYCGQFSTQATGKDIYPLREELYGRKFYQCVPCDAYVGTHISTGKPMGTLANAKLRKLRSAAHLAFDPFWKNKEEKRGRTTAYLMLAKGLNIPVDECHIAHFNEDQCQRTIDLCNSRELYRHDPCQDRLTNKVPYQEKD